ncbi:MAG TPA: hypothetical protein VFQ39_07410 [Longimicrobium sp.]|nr:hypothetical protein [Longimicrobium sp.]
MTRATAVTLAMQCAIQALTLAFGVVCLWVARRAGRGRDGGWYFTGAAFTVMGVHALVQSVVAVWAVVEGDQSALYRRYVAVLPFLNDPRILVVLGYALVTLVQLVRRRPTPSSPWRVWSFFLSLLALGTALSTLEGPFAERVHYSVIAAGGAATVVVLLASLYRALVIGAFDYLLWTAMVIYAVREAVSASIFSVQAWIGIREVWTPDPRLAPVLALVSLVMMLGCSLLRLRRPAPPPGLMERVRG